MRGFAAVAAKEARHILRDGATLRLALMIPVFQLVMFGLIDTNVRHVPTAVWDQSRSAESRLLLDEIAASSVLRYAREAGSREELRRLIVAGTVQVGIEIPPDFQRLRLAGRTAPFLVLVDGSDAQISGQVLAAVDGAARARSLVELQRVAGNVEVPIQAHPQLLFNPDARSANLLIPGLVAILLTFSGTLLTAFAIARERERGTLEQLLVTPVSPLGVLLGKLLPYLGLALVQFSMVLLLMWAVFGVPIHGSVGLLAALSLLYLVSLLAVGLLISARANTQAEATQYAMLLLLPSVLLSGYIFPLASLPAPLRLIGQALPATHFIAISRGIIMRGAGFAEVREHAAALGAIALALVALGAGAFRRVTR